MSGLASYGPLGVLSWLFHVSGDMGAMLLITRPQGWLSEMCLLNNSMYIISIIIRPGNEPCNNKVVGGYNIECHPSV